MTTADDGGGLVAALDGELDIAGVADIRPGLEALLGRPAQPLQLDLSGLTFLDSSGVAVLVRLANHFGSVSIRSAAPPVRRVLEVLGLAGRFGLDGD